MILLFDMSRRCELISVEVAGPEMARLIACVPVSRETNELTAGQRKFICRTAELAVDGLLDDKMEGDHQPGI